MLTAELKREIKKYQKMYFAVKAEYETIKAINEENEKKILQDNIFTDRKGKRARRSWHIEDEEQFKNFMLMHYLLNKESGLPVVEIDHVVYYPKFKELQEIENKLLELQLRTVPKSILNDIKKAHQHHKYREDALQLILKLSV